MPETGTMHSSEGGYPRNLSYEEYIQRLLIDKTDLNNYYLSIKDDQDVQYVLRDIFKTHYSRIRKVEEKLSVGTFSSEEMDRLLESIWRLYIRLDDSIITILKIFKKS